MSIRKFLARTMHLVEAGISCSSAYIGNTINKEHWEIFGKNCIFIILMIILLSGTANAATVRYYLNATSGVNIGADGTTNVTSGTNQNIPPIITALMDTTGNNAGNARSISHPSGLYTHSRWYFTSDYSQLMLISSNPAGSVSIRGSTTSETLIVRLYDYDSTSGSKTLIGSSSEITLTGGGTTTTYTYTISSSAYAITQGHRLMLQYDFNQASTTATARVYASQTASYIDVVETPVYILSGYITNQSTGTAISGVTVATNTSSSTTTDGAGYYSLYLSNGTYLITASKTGYSDNSTTQTINGANLTDINLSILFLPVYQLSGYVTDGSNGQAISGATVATNTSISTTTDSSGYYQLDLNNGTYIITASKSNYSDNSITRTVDGAGVTGANISLSFFSGILLVAANRYVILDDWTTAGLLGTGYSLPGATHSSNSWTGINTRINATALFINNAGSPLSGEIITFKLYMPNGTELTTASTNNTTNAYGLANFSFDMDVRNYYGNWTIKASIGDFSDNTSFIYNWWGCGIGGCRSGHSSDNPSGTATINSPYLSGRDTTTSRDNAHATTCTNCHQSFDGKPGANAIGGANHTNYAQDVHKNLTCDNTNCHQTIASHDTNAIIGSCYNANCHKPSGTTANRSDISNKTTLSSSTVSTAHSEYSELNGTDFNGTFHTPDSTVPCIICHGPMHNITKPDESLRFIKDTNTEDSQCKTCHSSNNEHNSSNTTSGGVNCTLCHSDDVHVIQVFAQNGTYVTGKTNSARGNCTNCHQNSSFITTLKSQANAGSYTGRDPPAIQSPMKHSDDPIAGAKWNQTPGYWTNTSQVTWCLYCHGNTSHSAAALGGPSDFKGDNLVDSSISTSTSWCISCHMQGYSSGSNDYSDMVTNFAESLVPPEITGDETYGANESNSAYFNHSTVDLNDATCSGCHRTISTTMTGFMHNVSTGIECEDCHNSWSAMNGSYNKPLSYVNSTLVNSSVHANVSCMSCHTYIAGHPNNGTYPKYGWKWCEDCHANTQDPQNNKSRHLIVSDPWNNLFGGTSVVNITTCETCHDQALYNNSKNTYGKDKEIDCDYCHSFPDNSRG